MTVCSFLASTFYETIGPRHIQAEKVVRFAIIVPVKRPRPKTCIYWPYLTTQARAGDTARVFQEIFPAQNSSENHKFWFLYLCLCRDYTNRIHPVNQRALVVVWTLDRAKLAVLPMIKVFMPSLANHILTPAMYPTHRHDTWYTSSYLRNMHNIVRRNKHSFPKYWG